LEILEDFLDFTTHVLKHASERARAQAILNRWGGLWVGKDRTLTSTLSNHGSFLHFNQALGGHWCQVFSFHAAHRHGLSLRGPDPDRARKSHKLRRHPLDPKPLDAIFAAWSAHPEGRPAGLALEFYLEETPDEVWEACLQEALQHL
jgi:hypothetical protein